MGEPNRLEMFANLFRLLQTVFDLFFPLRCLACQSAIHAPKKVLCLYCELNLPLTFFHLMQPSPLKQQLFAAFPIHQVFSLYVFEESALVESLLYEMKYKGNRSVGLFFGQKLASLIAEAQLHFDGIIGVPLHPKRKRKRGFNQVDLIGECAANSLNIPYYGNFLKRVKHIPKLSQVNKDRTAILQDAFRINSRIKLSKGHYLLIDDILTTGATLKACSREINKIDRLCLSIATIVYRN